MTVVVFDQSFTSIITKGPRRLYVFMPGLTEADKERIRKVAQIPRFKRAPELLCPEEDEYTANEGEPERPAAGTK